LLSIVERQQQVATSVLPAAEARYVAGTAAQSDVLKARTEAALLVEERNALVQQQRAAIARLDAVLDRPGTTPTAAESFQENGVAAKSVPPLESLYAVALQTNPRLRERRAVIATQVARVELAKREHLPDFDVSVQYGQRDRLPDMITATIGVPVPIQRGRKQTATARAAQFDLASAEAGLRSEENELRAEIARTHAAVERDRANLELLDRAILPQARATFASASASYQSGRGELLNVLDAMRAVFATETMYIRTLAEFAKALAELQALVGEGVVR
jgi:outer membrane protein TolC